MDSEDTLLFDLAGITVRIRGHRLPDMGSLDAFLASSPEPDHEYTAEICDALPAPEGEEIFSAGNQRVYLTEAGQSRYTGPVELGVENAHACIRRLGFQTRLSFLRRPDMTRITPRILLNHLDLEHLLTIHRGFLLHASFIDIGGRAVLFTAPSETGKSTQARLWCENRNARLINGDRAGVRITDSGILACGVPFSGSSDVRKNVKLPLCAIVYLSQAPENSITRLHGVRAFRRIWEGCSVNLWDRNDLELATRTVSEVAAGIPVYHLACTPDIRAVELLASRLEVDV